MNRVYTDEIYDELISMLDGIHTSALSELKDDLGDFWYTIQEWTGALSADNYINSISAYHRMVLDQHDTDVDELAYIFDNISGEDNYCRCILNEYKSDLSVYGSLLKKLCEALNPDCHYTAEQISNLLSDDITDVTDANERFNTSYEELLANRERQLLKDSFKELLSAVLSVTGDTCSFIMDVATGEWVSAVADVWDIINDTFNVATEVIAIVITPVGWLVSNIPGLGNGFRLEIVERGERMHNNEGLADILENECGWREGAGAIRTIDTAAAAHSLYKSITKFGKEFTKSPDTWMKDEMRKLLGYNCSDINQTGWITEYMEWKDRLKNDKSLLKFLEVLCGDNTVYDYIFNNTNVAKKTKDLYEAAEKSADALGHIIYRLLFGHSVGYCN